MKNPSLTITSPAFKHQGNLPSKYTCQGRNINPPITISGTPEGTKSLALIVDDPDASGSTFDHWIVWNIPPADSIDEDTIPGTEGKNDFGINHYKGPCPPSGTHRYFFKVYALDGMLELKAGAEKASLEKAMQTHILASGELIGLYKKS